MARFKPYDYNQTEMVPVSLSEQLESGTLEEAIHYTPHGPAPNSIDYHLSREQNPSKNLPIDIITDIIWSQ